MSKTILTLALIVFIVIGCSSPIQYTKHDEIVVLAHGLGRSDSAMWRLEQRLTNAGYKVCTLNYATIGERLEDVINMTSAQIDRCLSFPLYKAHFVGHSLGGLMIRAYLQNNQQILNDLNFGNVVLIGTPNKGSEVAEHYKGTWVMDVGGEVGQALVTDSSGFSHQLKDIDINAGVIAGTKSSGLTQSLFKGPNDGLVSVESTKLNSMKDFIKINVNHSSMRYDESVAQQAIYFLQHGKFKQRVNHLNSSLTTTSIK